MRIGSLCSGVGLLDVAVQRLIPGAQVVWHCETDLAASAVLQRHWPAVPNHGDITAVVWSTVEPVEVITAGFPCQDVSSAGRRAGLKPGTRTGIWSSVRDAIEVLRPRYVFLENVRGLLSADAVRTMEPGPDDVGDGASRSVLRALGAVLGDLADIGYDAQWLCIPASAVGYCHHRYRVFILAHPADASGCGRSNEPQRSAAARQQIGPVAGAGGGADARRVAEGVRRLEPIAGVMDSESVAPVTGPRRWQPTPRASDGSKGGPGQRGSSGDLMLPSAVMAMLPTPVANDSANSPDAHLAKKPGRTVVTSLQIVAEHDLFKTGGRLLPTPSVADGAGGHLSRSGERGSELLLPGVAKAYAEGALLPTPTARLGDSRGTSDPSRRKELQPRRSGELDEICVQRTRKLPTPTARGAKGRQPGNDLLPDVTSLLPTPRTSDSNGSGAHGTGGPDLCTAVAVWGPFADAIARQETLTGPAPSPTEPGARGLPRLSPRFVEWMIGAPPGWVTDTVMPDGKPISRVGALRCLGNGVVPDQAYAGFGYLLPISLEAVS